MKNRGASHPRKKGWSFILKVMKNGLFFMITRLSPDFTKYFSTYGLVTARWLVTGTLHLTIFTHVMVVLAMVVSRWWRSGFEWRRRSILRSLNHFGGTFPIGQVSVEETDLWNWLIKPDLKNHKDFKIKNFANLFWQLQPSQHALW